MSCRRTRVVDEKEYGTFMVGNLTLLLLREKFKVKLVSSPIVRFQTTVYVW